ncbi:hypothetical protein RGU70_07410 [Herbaspirillum sp. RTI4]|uniref:hypothetical protein n=1 Tax=Herbaspirillum sp. RTI4 TaxID=3048640 RepID=UPI002AB536B5|nr:hypothetical protein [Herbaspirillum sp. RTI4]MDY7578145.1 hypothetical protein [Herbaspirillum sp. RTI4]MEA9980734.1 hypothetical protein [Herbaspirillum sp. RTI4]
MRKDIDTLATLVFSSADDQANAQRVSDPSGRLLIIIPIAFREDCMLPLKALSRNAEAVPFLRAMSRAQAWSSAFDYARFPATWKQMAACNAFADDITQHKLLHPNEIRRLIDN